MLGQYTHDVVQNIQNEKKVSKIFTPTSSSNDYVKSGLEGALVGESYVVGGPALAGVSSATLSISSDIADQKPIDWSGAVLNGATRVLFFS